VERYVVGLLKNFFECLCPFHVASQTPRGLHRDERVITDDPHPERLCCVGNHHTNGAQPDNTQGLPHDLLTGETFLLILHRALEVLDAGILPSPLNSVVYIASCKQQSGNHQFLHAVRVGPRRVYVVDPGAGPGDGFQLISKIH